MTIQEIVNQSTSWTKNPPATLEAIENCSTLPGFKVPDEYAEFLLICDGAEGFTPPNHPAPYFTLFRTERLIIRNQVLEVQRNHPGFLAIGSDGADDLFLMNTRLSKSPILMVPAMDDTLECAETVGCSFAEFLQRISIDLNS